MTRFSISQPVTQMEAPRLVSGKGRFTDDMKLDNQAYGFFLRSPHAHAEIISIDTRVAKQMPGVIDILTGADYEKDNLGPVTGISPMKRRDGSPMYRPWRPAITKDKVSHIGQAVAFVIAETIWDAKDAAEAIEVEYKPLPVSLSTADSNKPGAYQIYADCENNEAAYVERGNGKAVDEAIAKAAHVVRERFVISRAAAMTMEPRAVNAEWDAGRDHYTIYACHQRPYVWRTMMTKHLFKIPEHQMTLIAGDVGGSYGMKGGLYPEIPVAAWASKRTGRPVKWTCERSEALIADDQGRDMVIDAELALDKDGNFTAIRYRSNNNVGGFVTMLGFLTTGNILSACEGPYRTPVAHGEGHTVLTNTLPVSNYRAPGGAPGAYVLEALVEMAAGDMKIDPVELRRRNFIKPADMPHKGPLGGGIDCGDFESTMDKALKAADWKNREKRRAAAKKRGRIFGCGLATTIDPSAGPSPETAELRFDPGGTLTILCGSTAQGQSHETIYMQIVSQHLGIDVEKIRVVEGNTEKLSWGTGTGAARTATIGGTAVLNATNKVIAKAKRIAAHMMEAGADDIELKDGEFAVAGTDKKVTLEEVVQTAFQPNKLPADIEIGLFENATWSPDSGNVPNSAHVCEVEIDPETGVTEVTKYIAIHDVGVELNPLLVDGQVHGGIAQGLGQVLMEHIVYDEDGQNLTGSFMDYAMPRASDLCMYEVDRNPVPTKTNPLGVKGAGECGTVGALAAGMNAINDALREYGVRNFQMPATPARVWKAVNGGG
jgi:carbon-monoxide dehydrogenase large subunit